MKAARILTAVLATFVLFTGVASAADPPARRTGVHYLYLIRHGDYDWERGADPVTSLGLNKLGREQARLIGERLAALPVRMDALITSNYRRARETADMIGPMLGFTPVVDTLIHECSPASESSRYMEHRSPEEIAACESNLAAAWRKYAVASPDSDRRDVLVCHGNVIRWMVAHALNDDSRNWLRMDIGNASITVIAIRADGSYKVAAFSDTGHIPADEQTWTGRGAGWGRARRR